MKEKTKGKDPQAMYKFFIAAKNRKMVFYVSFGDPADGTIADFRLCEVRYSPHKAVKASSENVTLMFEVLGNQGFTFVIEAMDQLRIEFIDEDRVHFFDVKVNAVNQAGSAIRFSVKQPDYWSVRPQQSSYRLIPNQDQEISMTIKDQNIEVIYVSSQGASVFIPQANSYDLEVGRAIRHIEICVDGVCLKVNAEIYRTRTHLNGLKIVTDLRFMFFGASDETNLTNIVEKKLAYLPIKEALIKNYHPIEITS